MRRLNFFLVALAFLASIFCFSRLPGMVPMHWDINGTPDGYLPKAIAAFIMPSVTLVIFLLYEFLPTLDPLKSNYIHFRKEWHAIQTAIISFLTYMQLLVLYIAINPETPLLPPMFIGMGILFIYVGMKMSKVKQNFFIGVRVPWTLANETNWNKTHRFAKLTFMFAGVMMIVHALTGWLTPMSVFGGVLAAAFVPSVYSLLLYKKIID